MKKCCRQERRTRMATRNFENAVLEAYCWIDMMVRATNDGIAKESDPKNTILKRLKDIGMLQSSENVCGMN